MRKIHGKHQIEEVMRQRIRKKKLLALLDCRIDWFESYQTLYGIKESEKVVQILEQILSSVVDEIGDSENVLGYDTESHFVIITSNAFASKINEALKTRFNTEIVNYYSAIDRQRGYMVHDNNENIPFMHLSIGIALSDRSM